MKRSGSPARRAAPAGAAARQAPGPAPAGSQDPQPRPVGQELGNGQRRVGQQVLEVVSHEQDRPLSQIGPHRLPQRLRAGVAQADAGGNRGQQLLGPPQPRPVDETSRLVGGGHGGSHLHGQPRLADTPRADHSDQARALQQLAGPAQRIRAADQHRHRNRQPAPLDTHTAKINRAAHPPAGLERGYEVYIAVDATAGETLETHQVAVQRMIQAGVVPVTWLSLASQYQGSYTNHETVQGFLGLMTRHSAAFGMLLQGQAARHAVRVR